MSHRIIIQYSQVFKKRENLNPLNVMKLVKVFFVILDQKKLIRLKDNSVVQIWCTKRYQINSYVTYGNISIHPPSKPAKSNSRRMEPIPAVIGREAGFTLDGSPVHHRTTRRQTRQTTQRTHCWGQFRGCAALALAALLCY